MVAIADKIGRPSIPTNYAVATTVKTARTAGVAVLETYDLSKFPLDTPAFFLTYKKVTDPTTGEVSVTNVTSWKALVNPDNNTLTNLTLAPGYVDTGNAIGDFVELIPTSFWGNSLVDALLVLLNPDGTPKASVLKTTLGNDGRLVETLDELTTDVVSSGGIWTALTGFNASMSALAAYIDGYKNTVSAIASRSFTPSKDTYVDVLRNTTTNAFSLVYTEVANNAASPALAPNGVRIAKIITNGTALVSIGQEARDSLGNTIRPKGAVSGKDMDMDNVMISQPSFLYPTVVANKEVAVGKIEVTPGVFRTLWFMRFDSAIGNVLEQAYDPPYPNGAPAQIVHASLRLGMGGMLPWRTSGGNFIEWSPTSTPTRMISIKDAPGSWQGSPSNFFVWYYKAS